jgi:hypothetical protein
LVICLLECADIDENVSLFIIFTLPLDAVSESELSAFLANTAVALEVSITDTPKQSDPTARREKFEGTPVYTVTVPDDAERITGQVDGHWHTAWNISIPISRSLIICADSEHGRSKIPNPRVALTATLSVISIDDEPQDEIITADSLHKLAGQVNILGSFAGDPYLSHEPVLPLSRIISTGVQETPRQKPGRRICRHIFPCGSPLDIRMRYNPLEPEDFSINKEIVLLSVDLSVTPQAGAPVLVKNVKVEMDGGQIEPLQDDVERVLKRYDVFTLLFRYVRYGDPGGPKTVSTSATMIPLINDSAELSPQINSTWNKVLDFPRLSPPSQFTAPTQRVVSQIMGYSSTDPRVRHTQSSSISGRPTGLGHGRAQTLSEPLPRPDSVVSSVIESPHLSITIEVPSKGINPMDEFQVKAQVVNRSNRPMRLALYVQPGQEFERVPSRNSKVDKVLPRIPLSPATRPFELTSFSTNDTELRQVYLRELELKKGKPLVGLTVEAELGYYNITLNNLVFWFPVKFKPLQQPSWHYVLVSTKSQASASWRYRQPTPHHPEV